MDSDSVRRPFHNRVRVRSRLVSLTKRSLASVSLNGHESWIGKATPHYVRQSVSYPADEESLVPSENETH